MAINLEREGVALNAEERNKRNSNLAKIEQGLNGLEQSVGGAADDSKNAKELATSAVKTAETAEDKVDNVQTQLDTFVVEGDSSPQATQASVGADGTEYGGSLKARLDAEYNQTTVKLADIVVSVKSFGAVADADFYDETNKKYYSDSLMTIPATDNKPAFQAAIEYLTSVGGGTLYVPKGKYVLRSSVKWKTKVSMRGDGVGNTIFYSESELSSLFYALDYASDGSDRDNPKAWLEDCRFEDFECDMIGLTHKAASVGGKALFMLYMRRARFNNLLLKNTIGTALGCDFLTDTVISNVVVINAGRNWGVYDPVRGDTSTIGQSGIGIGTGALEEETVVVTDCHIYNCGNFGIFVETQKTGTSAIRSKFAKITNCHVEGNRIGIANKGSGGTLIANCSSFNNKEYGIEFLQESSGDSVMSCDIKGNVKYGIRIKEDYLGNLIVSGNRIHGSGSHGVSFGPATSQKSTKDILISENIIYDNGGSGIFIDSAHKNIDLKGNTLYNNGQLKNGNFVNKGIYLQSVDMVKVKDNIFYDNQTIPTQTFTVFIGAGVLTYFLQGNVFSGGKLDVKSMNGVIQENEGTVIRGRGTFADGQQDAYVNHYFLDKFGRNATFANAMSFGNATIHVGINDGNQTRFRRSATTGTLDFYYEIRL